MARARPLLEFVSERPLCHSRKDSLPVGSVGNNVNKVAALRCWSSPHSLLGPSETFEPRPLSRKLNRERNFEAISSMDIYARHRPRYGKNK